MEEGGGSAGEAETGASDPPQERVKEGVGVVFSGALSLEFFGCFLLASMREAALPFLRGSEVGRGVLFEGENWETERRNDEQTPLSYVLCPQIISHDPLGSRQKLGSVRVKKQSSGSHHGSRDFVFLARG